MKQQLRSALVAAQWRGDTALTLPLFWRRSTISPVFFGRHPRSSLHSLALFPPVPVRNKQPRFCGRKAAWPRNADPSTTPSSALADLAHRPAKPVPQSLCRKACAGKPVPQSLCRKACAGKRRAAKPSSGAACRRPHNVSACSWREKKKKKKAGLGRRDHLGTPFLLSNLPVKTAMGGIKANP